MTKRIFITNEQYSLFKEGISYTNTGSTRNLKQNIGFNINSKTDDKSNKDVDTRVFGKRRDIVNGDGTYLMGKKLGDKYNDARNNVVFLEKALEWVKNGCNGKFNGGTEKQRNFFFNKKTELEQENANDPYMAQKEIVTWLESTISRHRMIMNLYDNKYFRSNYDTEETGDEIIMRYNLSKVPETNIDVIALFEMNDFNFSDAIKNGELRQNGKTDKLLNINKSERETNRSLSGKNTYKKLPIDYDDNITPDIMNNFSLTQDNIGNYDEEKSWSNIDHFKKSYGVSDKSYTSVSQFIDKSILTANTALKEIGYKPSVLVSCPSSSKFNHYYCINLSRKLGIEYIPDFFKRNVINMSFDEETEMKLTNKGATDKDKENIKKILRNAVFNEIISYAKKPIISFVSQYYHILSNIAKASHSREKVDINFLTLVLMRDICEVLIKRFYEDSYKTMTYKIIAQNYLKGTLYKNFNDNAEANNKNFIRQEIGKRIKLNIGQKVYIELIKEVDNILQQYSNKFEEGMTFNFSQKAFKIVEIEKRFRNCINNVYIISDKVLNKQNNNLQKKYKNSNFLVFDEDINSGATLKLVCELLQDKIDNSEEHIKCLVNGVSLGGR